MEIEIGAVLETHDSQRPTFAYFCILGPLGARELVRIIRWTAIECISRLSHEHLVYSRYEKKAPEFPTIIFVWA